MVARVRLQIELDWEDFAERPRIPIQPSVGFFNLFNFSNFDLPPNTLSGVVNGAPGSINGTSPSRSNRESGGNRYRRLRTGLAASYRVWPVDYLLRVASLPAGSKAPAGAFPPLAQASGFLLTGSDDKNEPRHMGFMSTPTTRSILANPGGLMTPENLQSKRPRLLCVDDAEIALQIRKVIFQRAGYDVSTATSGECALEIFKAEPIDLVIADHFLSEKTGTEIAAK